MNYPPFTSDLQAATYAAERLNGTDPGLARHLAFLEDLRARLKNVKGVPKVVFRDVLPIASLIDTRKWVTEADPWNDKRLDHRPGEWEQHICWSWLGDKYFVSVTVRLYFKLDGRPSRATVAKTRRTDRRVPATSSTREYPLCAPRYKPARQK